MLRGLRPLCSMAVLAALGCSLLAPSKDEIAAGPAAGSGGANTGGSVSGGAGGVGGTTGGTGGAGGTSTGGAAGSGGSAGTGGAAGNDGGGATGGTSSGGGAGGTSGGGSGGGGTGGSGGTATIPKSGLALWLDATVGAPTTGSVSKWLDQSGNSMNATQVVTGSQPSVVSVNGLPAVQFDGTDDRLVLPPGFGDFSQGATLFAVARFDVDNNCPPIIQLCNGEEVDDISLQREAGQSVAWEVYDNSASTGSQAMPTGIRRMMVVVHDTSNSAAFRFDGSPANSASLLLPVNTERKQNFIGHGLYAGCGDFGGVLHELLLYSRALTSTEVTQVEGYLQKKWGCCT